MSEVFWHLGLTIETDASGPSTLRIDGVNIPVAVSDGVFTSPVLPAIRASSLNELAIRIIDNSPERCRREFHKSVHVAKLKEGVEIWNRWREDYPHIRPLLSGETLNGAEFGVLRSANFAHADLQGVDLRLARLEGANFHEASLANAKLDGAFLNGANFCRADLYSTELVGAHLEGANLQGAQLAKTNFRDATLHDCTIYGLSAWDLQLDGASQKNLRIVYTDPADESRQEILVDDLSVAQFIYFLLHNKDLRRAIDTITSKVVLILGRFTKGDRKDTLDEVREALRRLPTGYVPVMFDFPRPESQNYLETVVTLAHLARFVIADMTEAKIVLEEVPAIVSGIAVPIQPVMLEGSGEEPITLVNLRKNHRSVMKTFLYRDRAHLIASLEADIIGPAERLSAELRAI